MDSHINSYGHCSNTGKYSSVVFKVCGLKLSFTRHFFALTSSIQDLGEKTASEMIQNQPSQNLKICHFHVSVAIGLTDLVTY